MPHMDLQNIRGYICMIRLYFSLYKLHLIHKGMGCKDQLFLLVHALGTNDKNWKTNKINLTCSDSLTCHKRISSIAWITFAIWIMVCYIAFCIYATNTGARVSTVLVETCLVIGTLCIYDTFGLAFNVGIANIVPDTAARGSTSLF